jgi:hypothetical protein
MDHDLCESCYNLPESDPVKLEKSKHSCPCVMKGTLLMSPGRRQWLGLEGKIVLEEEKHAARTLERRGASTASRPTSDAGSQHGEEVSTGNGISIDSEYEPIRKQRTCGRCSDAISFDSTYYKCLGHLCRGALNSEICPTFHLKVVLAITDYYLCEKCEPDLTDVEGHQHKWWHSLLIIPKSYLATEDTPKASETTSITEVPDALSEGITGEETPPSISSLNEKISGLEEKLDSTRQALEGRVTRLDTSVEELKQLLMQVLSNRTNL